MRLFVGIPLAPEVVDALERFSASVRSPGDGLLWSTPETWHITLQFLGETPAEKYDRVVAAFGEIRSPMVPVWVGGAGTFDRAGVFWAGVNVSPELRLLERKVTAATTPLGFAAEERPYHPHITLARAKGDDRARVLRKIQGRVKQEIQFPRFTAIEFLLYESFLGRGGTRHEMRAHFQLGQT